VFFQEKGTKVDVKPAEADNSFEIVQHETFAPVLYLLKYSGTVENALELQNGVAQGLSSAIMTNNLREAEHFLCCRFRLWYCQCKHRNFWCWNRWCFWWWKETGGGRESGSDAWKVYMRRQTNTINWNFFAFGTRNQIWFVVLKIHKLKGNLKFSNCLF
jgi:aldehyde dehydrogenase (NAD+)